MFYFPDCTQEISSGSPLELYLYLCRDLHFYSNSSNYCLTFCNMPPSLYIPTGKRKKERNLKSTLGTFTYGSSNIYWQKYYYRTKQKQEAMMSITIIISLEYCFQKYKNRRWKIHKYKGSNFPFPQRKNNF